MESVEPVERRGVGGMINDKLYLLIVASPYGKIAVHKRTGRFYLATYTYRTL